ncbi:MAG: hypothetical protein MUE46_01890 [Xanthomonadales bacterium]|jgi:hypothetical protein|nr:hypothetical protein [Xanthomonadales bacterium]
MGTSFQKTVVEGAVKAFFGHFSLLKVPQASELTAASAAARIVAFRALQDDAALQKEFPQLTPQSRSQIHYDLLDLASPLELPAPAIYLQVAPLRMACVALLGAFFGMFLLTPATLYLLEMRDMGLFLGAPLGAFLFVWAGLRITEDAVLRRFLGGILGSAVAIEVALFIQEKTPFGQIWARLSGQESQSLRKRLLAYVLIAGALFLAKKEQKIDRARYVEQIQVHVEIWVAALFRCIRLYHGRTEADRSADSASDLVGRLGPVINRLHYSSPQTLAAAAHELIIESRNLGFGGLEGESGFLAQGVRAEKSQGTSLRRFVWSPECRETHAVFGAVELGDLVQEEKTPVIFQGVVTEKGLVRKVRQR